MTDYGYARVSTLDQNPRLQLNALEAAGCWPIVEERVSGVATKRAVRDEVLRIVKAGDTVTCWKLDRWGRSTAELLATIEDLDQRGVRFRCLTQPLDTRSAFGKMQLTLLAAFAEFERELNRERVLAGKARMKAEGRHPGGPALFGLAKDHQTIILEQAELLCEAARRVLEDREPLSRVVDDFNTRGYRPGKATRWRVTHLRRILLNERVTPIIGEETYQDLVRTFTGRERQKLGRPAGHLLSGILTCGREGCGQPMYAQPMVKRGVREVYYRCKKGGGGRFAGCGSTFVAEGRADRWAEEMFLAAIVSPDFAQALARRQAELLAGEVTAAELDEWRAEMDELEQVMPTRYAPPNAKQRHDELRRMVEQATAQLMAQPDLQALVDLPRSEEQLRDAWAAWTIAERRTWLRRLVERIEVKPATTRSRASSVEDRLAPVWRI